MSTATVGLVTSEWSTLLRLIDECSQEQLETVRELVTGALVNYPAKDETEMPKIEEFESKSMQIAMELWDAMKGEEDVFAAELPKETLDRITRFAKEVRNRTLEEIAGAVEKSYSKFTETVVESIRKQKE